MGKSDFTVGIDVGASKKGFHIAVKKVDEASCYSLLHAHNPTHIVAYITNVAHILQGRCRCIAIDCPPKAIIESDDTRLAEKELRARGYRIIWTPRKEEHKKDWMINGENLWNTLQNAFPDTEMIETFPTANADYILGSNTLIPMDILFGKTKRAYYKDYLDAAICAATAEKMLKGQTTVLGAADILGPVHIPKLKIRHYALCLIHDRERSRTLLGYKKQGFGKDRWNGFGGKVEPKDMPTPSEKRRGITQYAKAIKREVYEESGVTLTEYKQVGTLHFMFDVEDHIFFVHVFKADEFTGTPVETDEMLPRWFDIDAIPYDKMWLDDPFWVPLLLDDIQFRALFIFSDHDTIKHHSIEILTT